LALNVFKAHDVKEFRNKEPTLFIFLIALLIQEFGNFIKSPHDLDFSDKLYSAVFSYSLVLHDF
jgi:hypothetical protein